MKKLFAVCGAGGFASEVIPLVRAQFGATHEIVCVETEPHYSQCLDIPVITDDEFLSRPGEKSYSIAIADAKTREMFAKRMEGHATAASVIAQNAFIGEQNILGEGMILCPFTTITSTARIGRHFHANLYSYVAHGCVIGDYVTFAPGVKCNGNVHIGDGAYIGTGAIIRPGSLKEPLTIGAGAIIGMGAVVTRPVAAGVTVVGNPAQPLQKK